MCWASFFMLLVARTVQPSRLEGRCTSSEASVAKDSVEYFEEFESEALEMKLLQTHVVRHRVTTEVARGGIDTSDVRKHSKKSLSVPDLRPDPGANLSHSSKSSKNHTIDDLAMLEINSSLADVSLSELKTTQSDLKRATRNTPRLQGTGGAGGHVSLSAPSQWWGVAIMTVPMENGLTLAICVFGFLLAGLAVLSSLSVHFAHRHKKYVEESKPRMIVHNHIQLDRILAYKVPSWTAARADKEREKMPEKSGCLASAASSISHQVGTTFMLPIALVNEDAVGRAIISFEVVVRPAAWPLKITLRRSNPASTWEQLELEPDVLDADTLVPWLLCEPVAEAVGHTHLGTETDEKNTGMLPTVQRLHQTELIVTMLGSPECCVTMETTGQSVAIRQDGEDVALVSGDATCMQVGFSIIVGPRQALQLLASVLAVLAFDLGNVGAINLTQKSP